MKNLIRSLTGAVVVAAITGASVVGVAGVAAAATTPPWEPLAASQGGLTFYNAAGQQITGGSLTAPFATYVEGGATLRSGDTKATMFAYTPVSGKDPALWSGAEISSSTVFPNTSAPGALATATAPVVSGATSDLALSDYITEYPNNDTSADGYANLYVLRLKTSGPGLPFVSTYDAADIQVTGSTWQVVYPTPPLTSTQTTLTTSPSTAQTVGTSVTLTATVSPAESGTVQFEVGSTNLGAPQTVVNGQATYITTALPVGDDSLSAVFTPTPFLAVAGSTGTASLTINPAQTVPNAPTNVTAVAGNAQATVSWSDPVNDGNSAISSYTVTASPGGAFVNVTGASATQGTVTGLTNGVAYTFTVTATNGIGTSAPSSASSAVTPSTVPDAPSITNVTAGNASATITWTDPSNEGSTITGYTVTVSPGGATKFVTGATATSTTVTGLTNGTSYTFTVSATNANGAGASSAPSSSVTPATTPSAPTNIAVTPSNGSLAVSWTAPSSTGGASITGYTVTVTGGATPVTATVSGTSATVSGLVSTVGYKVSVVATNLVGNSTPGTLATTVYADSASSVSALALNPVVQTGKSFGVLLYGVAAGTKVSLKTTTGTLSGVTNAFGQYVFTTSVAKVGVYSLTFTAGKKTTTAKVYAPSIVVTPKVKHGTSFTVAIANALPKTSVAISVTNGDSSSTTTSAAGTDTVKLAAPKAGSYKVTVTIDGVTFPAATVVVS